MDKIIKSQHKKLIKSIDLASKNGVCFCITQYQSRFCDSIFCLYWHVCAAWRRCMRKCWIETVIDWSRLKPKILNSRIIGGLNMLIRLCAHTMLLYGGADDSNLPILVSILLEPFFRFLSFLYIRRVALVSKSLLELENVVPWLRYRAPVQWMWGRNGHMFDSAAHN